MSYQLKVEDVPAAILGIAWSVWVPRDRRPTRSWWSARFWGWHRFWQWLQGVYLACLKMECWRTRFALDIHSWLTVQAQGGHVGSLDAENESIVQAKVFSSGFGCGSHQGQIFEAFKTIGEYIGKLLRIAERLQPHQFDGPCPIQTLGFKLQIHSVLINS